MRIVPEGEQGLVSRFGKYQFTKEPGLVKINRYLLRWIYPTVRFTESLQLVDTKIQVIKLPHQICSTKDNRKVYLTPVLYYRIVDAYKATFMVGSLRNALEQRVQTTLEHILRGRTQETLLGGRDCMVDICNHIIVDMESDVASWGVKIEEILIKEFSLKDASI